MVDNGLGVMILNSGLIITLSSEYRRRALGFVEEWRFNQDAFCAFEGCRNHRHALAFIAVITITFPLNIHINTRHRDAGFTRGENPIDSRIDSR